MSVLSRPRVRGIVLAGVHHWSGSAFERAIPRPLVPVAQSPLICYVLRWLRDAGVGTATICANSASRFVRKCLADGERLALALDYFEDWTPRGPAGCVRDAGVHTDADLFVVADGTIIPQVDLGRLLASHENSQAAMTVVVNRDTQMGRGGEDYLTPSGIYVLERRVLEAISSKGYQDIKEVLIPHLHRAGESIVPYIAEGYCPRVTGADSYLAVNEWVLQRIAREAIELGGYRRVGESRLHPLAQVDPGAHLIGPVLVGPQTRIAAGATLVGPTTLGAGCTVAERALICRSVLWDRCQVGRDSMVDQCVLTHEAVIAARAKFCNMVHLPPQRQQRSFWQRLFGRRPVVRPSVERIPAATDAAATTFTQGHRQESSPQLEASRS